MSAVDDADIRAAVAFVPLGTVLLVRLAGPIDATSADLLDAALKAAGRGVERAVVDLTEVTFFGAPGMNFLAQLAAHGRAVQLIGPPPGLAIDRQLRAASLHTLIVVC